MQQSPGTKPSARSVLEVVIEVSKRQSRTLGEMRVALERGDRDEAIRKARVICGLDEEQ